MSLLFQLRRNAGLGLWLRVAGQPRRNDGAAEFRADRRIGREPERGEIVRAAGVALAAITQREACLRQFDIRNARRRARAEADEARQAVRLLARQRTRRVRGIDPEPE